MNLFVGSRSHIYPVYLLSNGTSWITMLVFTQGIQLSVFIELTFDPKESSVLYFPVVLSHSGMIVGTQQKYGYHSCADDDYKLRDFLPHVF